ncbi:MAG: anaerobic ribonucleoside-triphosphate reductase activating protein [Candidatus Magasanikbacteria bacterium]|nr:anaerobic ribonucleoside-triphosphate reductase activating protein [Candidatus Magasanikbacteria bacterium]
MLISAVQKFTLLDYPGKTSCIVFTPGCNFRCGYCHNPEFVLPEKIKEIKDSFIPEEIFFNFLDKRVGLLDGVVISGGEPTLMPDLENFIVKVKEKGFLVKLDTNGNRFDNLKNLVDKNLLDFIAMDIKTSLEEYKNVSGNLVNVEDVQKSIDFIKNCGVDYEFRTTMVKELHTEEVVKKMLELLKGSKSFYLQQFRPRKILKEEFSKYNSFSELEIEEIKKKFEKVVEKVGIRE